MKLINLREIQDSDIKMVGGKALSLAKMLRSDISIPDGLVVTTKHFNSFLDENYLKEKIDNLLKLIDLEKNQSLNDYSSKIFNLILKGIVSDRLQEEIIKTFDILNAKFVAVRSSAVMEDGKENAWAGQFDSFLNIGEEKLIDHIKKCWASLFSPRALYYKITKNHQNDTWGMAVLIQKMINADSSGIAFSVHPQTKNDKHIYIESSYGLGEAIVSGAIIPDHFVVHKDTLEILDMNISQKDTALYNDVNGETKWVDISPEKAVLQSLSLGQIKKLVEIINKIEKYFGSPCDIEWVCESGRIHIVQSRPITTTKTMDNLGVANIAVELQKGFTSIINWLAKTKEHDDIIADAIAYDNKKAERLTFLNKTIGLPINKTHVLPLSNFDINSKDLSLIIEDRGGANISHAFRVAPIEGFANIFDIQKHYGLTFNEFGEKLKTLEIPLDKAEVRITNFRGSPLGFSAVILITKEGIIGEIVDDDLYVLTYMDSVKEGKSVVSFFKEPNSPVVVLSKNEAMVAKVQEILNKLSVGGRDIELKDSGYETSDGYVIGYYEYVEGKNGDSAFTDMNTKRISNNISVKDAILQLKNKFVRDDVLSKIQGLVVYKKDSKVEGKVCLFRDDLIDLPDGVIFVSPMTTVDHLPFMKKALAVITDSGGLMSHPAIISRELKIPTVVGTKNASKILKDGDMIVIDMENGIIEVL